MDRLRARNDLQGRSVFIARLYMFTFGVLSVAATILAGSWGVLAVAFPATLAIVATFIALGLMRRNEAAGRGLLVVLYALIGAFFIWAQRRAVLGHRPETPPFIVHQVGSALHRHFFPYSPLVMGLIHVAMAMLVIADPGVMRPGRSSAARGVPEDGA